MFKLIRKQRGQGVKPIDHLTVEGETYNNGRMENTFS